MGFREGTGGGGECRRESGREGRKESGREEGAQLEEAPKGGGRERAAYLRKNRAPIAAPARPTMTRMMMRMVMPAPPLQDVFDDAVTVWPIIVILASTHPPAAAQQSFLDVA